MKSVLFLVLAFVTGSLCAQDCGPQGCVDQAAATRKIEYMVQNNIYNRHIGPMIGRFEGIGYSANPTNIRTCVPRQRMTLTADVVRRTRDGMYLRIRIWR
jgi:hypothetical protein